MNSNFPAESGRTESGPGAVRLCRVVGRLFQTIWFRIRLLRRRFRIRTAGLAAASPFRVDFVDLIIIINLNFIVAEN